jgi:hypothetical protein
MQNVEMRVWSSGEEAYVAPNVEAVLEFHRTEYGLPDGDFPDANEWHEQTGKISITFETDYFNEFAEELLRDSIRSVSGKRGGIRITKLAQDWCKGVTKTEMLWSTNW